MSISTDEADRGVILRFVQKHKDNPPCPRCMYLEQGSRPMSRYEDSPDEEGLYCDGCGLDVKMT